jgi:pyridoxal phosphate enzyme (YggS family)
MIGHLQRNKVRDVLPIVHSIQSVDSLRLAQEIEKEAAKAQRSMPVLLEINSGEEQKFGAPLETAIELAAQIAQMPHVQLQGLMSMAPLTEDDGVVRATFARTRELFEQIRSRGFAGEGFKELSMGMSGDFEIAVEQGATMVRLGSVLFGNS